MGFENLDENERLVVTILQDKQCYSQAESISPQELIEECKKKNVDDPQVVESATVRLIDNDLVEYEMNDKLETTQLWLLKDEVA